MSNDEIDDLIIPVCDLAEKKLNREGADPRHHRDIDALIIAARNVKRTFGFSVEGQPS